MPTQETQETQVQSLGREDPLEKELATHSSVLAWEIIWTRGLWWATVHGVTKSQTRLNRYTCMHRHIVNWTRMVFWDSFILPMKDM